MRNRVLLVDDDPAWLDLASFHFEGRGLDITCARSAREAETWLQRERFDAVITDVAMPGEDGWSFRRRMRTTPAGRRLPIALLSSSAEYLAGEFPARPLFDKATPLHELAAAVESLARVSSGRSVSTTSAHASSSTLATAWWRLRLKLVPTFRRALNVLGALFGLVLLVPLLLFVALAIRLEDGGPIFFRQTRVGRGGRRFCLLKFRTMSVDADRRKQTLFHQNDHADSITFKMKEDPRITRIGRILRRSSADELPQLWNVLRGEMGLVGPRPPTPEEVENYGSEAWRRLDVTPGLTGLWQVSGRGDLAFPEQLELDVKYIQERSLWGDIKLIFLTVPAVISGRGAY